MENQKTKPLCHLPFREEIQKQAGWVGEKLHEVEKHCDRFQRDRKAYHIKQRL